MPYPRFLVHLLLGVALAVPSLPVVDCCCTRSAAESASVPACCAPKPVPLAEPGCPHCVAQADSARLATEALKAGAAHQCQCRHDELPAEVTCSQHLLRRQQLASPIDSPQPEAMLFGLAPRHQRLGALALSPPSAARSKQQLLCRWLI